MIQDIFGYIKDICCYFALWRDVLQPALQRLKIVKRMKSSSEEYINAAYNKRKSLCMPGTSVVHNAQKRELLFVCCVESSKSKKLQKNLLTKDEESGRILRLSRKRWQMQPKKVEKKMKNNSKKVLTKQKGCGIIYELPQKRRRSRDWLCKKLKNSKKFSKTSWQSKKTVI